jgi:tRNA 2-thiouridine synthesizing protein A
LAGRGAVGARNLAQALTERRLDLHFDKELDTSGLACPLPIVKTKRSLADMASGQVLRVLATDPGSVPDMAAFAEQTGHALIESAEQAGTYVFLLKKG